MKVIIINGPNLNMLGKRDKNQYGSFTLEELEQYIVDSFDDELEFTFFQSNIEGEIISVIQNASQEYDALIINPGAYGHYSLAIKDSLSDCSIPKIEVHISNVFAREEFRQNLVTASSCDGLIAGLKQDSYIVAVNAIQNILKAKK